MTVARTTVIYRKLCGRRKESAAVRVLSQQHRRKLTYSSADKTVSLILNNKYKRSFTNKVNYQLKLTKHILFRINYIKATV